VSSIALKSEAPGADLEVMITHLAVSLLLTSPALAEDETHEGEAHEAPEAHAAHEESEHGDAMRTDRPDTTESPYTVPAGRFQAEHSLGSVSFEHEEEASIMRLDLGGFIAKAGLTSSLDVEVGWDGYALVFEHGEEIARGAGDMLVRVKWNLVGADGGDVALGLLPFVYAPVGDDDVARPNWFGGLIVPFSVQLSHAFHLGAMLEGAVGGDEQQHVHGVVIASVALGIHVAGPWELFFEVVSELELGEHLEWIPETNVGTAFQLGDDVRLDAGFDVAYHGEGVAYKPFVGLSWRI
jgi:hypothetical protein